MIEPKSVNFHTDGVGFTKLIRNFIEDGEVLKVYEILRDGGLPEGMIPDFFTGKLKFIGDTRVGDLSIIDDETGDFSNGLEQCLISMIRGFGMELWQLDEMFITHKNDKDIFTLIRIFGIKYFRDKFPQNKINTFSVEKILESGFRVITFGDLDDLSEDFYDGVILPSGDLITCGYQEHDLLYPLLYDMGIIKNSCWTDCDETLHISSSQLSGTLAHRLEYPLSGEFTITERQLQSLFKLRNYLSSAYGSHDKITKLLIDYHNKSENFGGKWNNLTFLNKYYNFNIPNISKSEIDGVRNCIRTSPKYSLPGLLESKFDLDENSISQIYETFDKYKSIRSRNELHIFYQEYIEGSNGVFHVDSNGLRCGVSKNRGHIVSGMGSDETLDAHILNELSVIGETLYKDLCNPIQVEFVVSGDSIYIVQLRLLENNPVNESAPPVDSITGKSFSRGLLNNVNSDDILILDSDGGSDLLIGKKALIIKSDVEFSHILALSKILRIPSLFSTGDFDITNSVVNFNTKSKIGWIEKV